MNVAADVVGEGTSSGRRIIALLLPWASFSHAAWDRGGPGRSAAGGRLLHSVQQLFQRDGVVALGILRRIHQRDLLRVVHQLVERRQVLGSFLGAEFLEIALFEYNPVVGGMVPLAQGVRRS